MNKKKDSRLSEQKDKWVEEEEKEDSKLKRMKLSKEKKLRNLKKQSMDY